jgi:carboxypeptidase T
MYAVRLVRIPYLLGRGPVIEEMTATTSSNQVDLSAVVDDRGNGGQRIVAAEYYIDVPPWRGGQGIRMVAADGSFDSPRERVVAKIGQQYGRHLIYVRGQDGNGNWGPMRAVWADFAPAPWSVRLPMIVRQGR